MPATQLAAPTLPPYAIGTQSPLYIGMASPAADSPSIAVVPLPESNLAIDVRPLRLSWWQRWSRRDCQRQLKAVTEQRLLAERLARECVCDAADAYVKLGVMLWCAGQSCGDGRWFEAEEAWVRGALLALHQKPDVPVADKTLWHDVIAALMERRVIKPSSEKGILSGDDYLTGCSLGIGGLAHVWKVFGLGAALKVYDGGARTHRSAEFHCAISDTERRIAMALDVTGLNEAARLGIGAAMVYHVDEYFLVREVVEGVTRDHVTDVLDEADIPRALASFELFREKLRDAGLGGGDINLGGNSIWDRRTGRWTLIDH